MCIRVSQLMVARRGNHFWAGIIKSMFNLIKAIEAEIFLLALRIIHLSPSNVPFYLHGPQEVFSAFVYMMKADMMVAG